MPGQELKSVGDVATLTDLLRLRAATAPERLAFSFLSDTQGLEQEATYGQLDAAARGLAACLQARCQPGDRVLVIVPPGIEFVAALFGCVYAGMVAVPAYPPRRTTPGRPNRDEQMLRSVIDNCRPAALLTTQDVLARWTPDFTGLAQPPVVLPIDELDLSAGDDWQPSVKPCDLAVLQYTSGSTRTPRGVMLTHSNLLYNSREIARCVKNTPETRGVVWLPPFHDMGLIGGILQPVYSGFPMWLMAPQTFIKRPAIWLESISRYRANTSGGPNFAYELCLERISDQELAGFDLSCWNIAASGAEPVQASTLRRFAERFARCGFRPEAFYPCYGMAETTLIATGGDIESAPTIWSIPRVDPQAGTAGTRELVSCGRSIVEQELLIVDPETCRRVPDGDEGEVWIRGPGVSQGYWGCPEETSNVFGAQLADDGSGPYLRTGDLGRLHGGELYITGRRKDVIIIGGRNYSASDVEQVAGNSHESLSPSRCAAFAVSTDNAEELVVAIEVDRVWLSSQRVAAKSQGARELASPDGESSPLGAAFAELLTHVRAAISAELDLRVSDLPLLKPLSLPKTASGKIQRSLCRERYLAGQLDLVEGP